MFTQPKLICSLALLLLAVPADASSMLYILTGPPGASGELFGTFDPKTGKFTQIGPGTEGSTGLVSGLNGQLLSLGFQGNLNSINPTTGATTLIGPTGLVDCADYSKGSPCGPKSANALGSLGGQIFATDFANNLYRVNPKTGVATLIGPTGIPALPFISPLTTNPDHTFNAYDETLFGANGNLYAIFDAFTVSLDTFTVASVLIPDSLYRIDPKTGATTLIGAIPLNLSAAASENGVVYAFNGGTNQVSTLDLATGHTSLLTSYDPNIGIVTGAVATPEPASGTLVLLGFAGLAVYRKRNNMCILKEISMTQQQKNYILGLIFAFTAAGNALADSPTFTSIDFPGASSTYVWTINTRGDIAGSYVNADKSNHGFMLGGGQYRTIDFPGATSTDTFAINSRGDVGGVYSAGGVNHGYTLIGGQFTTVDFPGASGSEVGAINARGDILGDYTLAGVRHGYLLSGGQFSTIDFPGATNTTPVAFNPQGDIVGTYNFAGVSHGFLLSDGDFTSIDFPGATRTGANGINAQGDIAGRYVADGVSHAFLLSRGLFSTIDYPGATFTSGDSMNQRGDILGRYILEGVTHGYVLTGFRPACAMPLASPRIAVAGGGAAVTHSSDFTVVTATKPAAAGEVLSVFATGLGPTRPSVGSGQPFPSSPLVAVDSLVEVRVNGRSAVVLGSVGLPGAVDGYQVNFRLSGDTAKGVAAIELSAAGVAGPPVNIIVQ